MQLTLVRFHYFSPFRTRSKFRTLRCPHEKRRNRPNFDHFSTPFGSQKLSGRPPEASWRPHRRPVRTRTRPQGEIPYFTTIKAPILASQIATLGTPPPLSPCPCRTFFLLLPPLLSPFKAPARRTLSQGRRIARACGHMRRPWKRHRNPTSPSLQT